MLLLCSTVHCLSSARLRLPQPLQTLLLRMMRLMTREFGGVRLQALGMRLLGRALSIEAPLCQLELR